MQGNLNEVLDGFHSLQGIGFLQDLRGHPEGLLVDHLLKLLQVSASHHGFQFEKVVHVPTNRQSEKNPQHQVTLPSVGLSIKVAEQHKARRRQSSDLLGGLNVPEKLKVPHRELGGHLHGAELQKGDLTLSQQVLSVVVRAQRLRFHVVLQVVPANRHTHIQLRVRGSRHLLA